LDIQYDGVASDVHGNVHINNNNIKGTDGIKVINGHDVIIEGNFMQQVLDVVGALEETVAQQLEVRSRYATVRGNVWSGGHLDTLNTGAVIYVNVSADGRVEGNDVWGRAVDTIDTAIEVVGAAYVAGNQYLGTHPQNTGTALTNEIVVDSNAIVGSNPGTSVSGAGSSQYEQIERLEFTREDLTTTTTGLFEVPMPACDVVRVILQLRVAPTGSAVTFDVFKNGTTIFTTQTNRPSCATTVDQDVVTTIEAGTFADLDTLRVDLEEVDSNDVAAGAALVIEYVRT
jgi:hypothetical protein